MKNLLVLMVALAGLVPGASGATRSVPSGYKTIQAAINAAVNGDTIVVASGTYNEFNLSFNGKSVVLKSAAGKATTVIDALSKGTVFVIAKGEGRATVIDGFTIRNGNGRNPVTGKYTYPGAIHIVGSSPTIQNCSFLNNTTAFGLDVTVVASGPGRSGISGGAIKAEAGSFPKIFNCLFSGNKASGNAGAIVVKESRIDLASCSFQNNVADLGGGAVFVISANGTLAIKGCSFSGNLAKGLADPKNSGTGGAVCITCGPVAAGIGAVAEVVSNSFTKNKCRFAGGGLSVFGSAVRIQGNTFNGNDGGQFAGGIHCETQAASGGTKPFIIENNLVVSNTCVYYGGGVHTFFEKTASTLLLRGNRIEANIARHPTATATTVTAADPVTGGGNIGLGGGIALLSGTGLHTISGNKILGNSGQRYGAGIIQGPPVSMVGNTISGNTARFQHAGIVLNSNVNVIVQENIFADNTLPDTQKSDSADRAGALWVVNAKATSNTPVISNNRFLRNRGYYAGGVVVSSSPGAKVKANTFKNNVSVRGSTGGSLFVNGNAGAASFVIVSNQFWGDTYGVFGENFGSFPNSRIRVDSNNFWANTAGVVRVSGAGIYSNVNVLNSQTMFTADLNTANDPTAPVVP